jgi:hypothetical protein
MTHKASDKYGQLLELTDVGTRIVWQDGPVSEVGVQGDQPETILPIIIDRLRTVSKDHPNRETSLAITHCEEALHWLQARKADREARGVEGTNEP